MNITRKSVVVALTCVALLAITGCSRQAGPIGGGDLVAYAVDNFDEAGLDVDAAATKALCNPATLDDTTEVVYIEGLVDVCEATQDYWGQTFGPKVQSVAVSLGKVTNLVGECQNISRSGSLGLASANRYYMTRLLTAEELQDTESDTYQLARDPNGEGPRSVVWSGYLPAVFEAGKVCAELVEYLEVNDGARVYVTFPAIINEDGETLWLQAILAADESIVVYTNGDDEYDPTYFGLWVEMLARR